jgi:TolB-like protein
MASPGSTWVSEAVYKNLVNKKEVTSEFVREEQLKNVSEPVKVYEITVKEIPGYLPDNIKAYQYQSTTKKSFKSKTILFTAAVLAIVLLAAYSLFFNSQTKLGKGNDENTQKSIAVLYFENMTGDKNQEYFSDGLTEEITSRLAKIKGLSVRGRTSVLPYKGKASNIKKIAEELKVTTILEGSVRQSGNTVRITAQLIDAKKDTHFWSQDFTRELKDIFQLQSDVAHAIAKKLEIKISGEESDKINQGSTKNIVAYDYYLKARHIAFNQYYYIGDSVAFVRSKSMYEQAIKADPGFALAYAGLADLYDAKRQVNYSKEADSLRHSLSLRAYQLDPNSAFVNNVRIWMLANRKEPLLDSAFLHAAKALRLEPEDNYNWQSMGQLLAQGDYGLQLMDLAIPIFKKAVELNPLDINSLASLGDCYHATGDLTMSDKTFQSVYELATNDQYFGVWWIIDWLIRSNRLDEAEQLLAKQNWDKINWASVLIMIKRGQKDEALKYIPGLDDAVIRAALYANLNMKEKAITELNKIPEKKGGYLFLINDEQWKRFRGDPEFEKILAKQKAIYDEYTKRYGKYVEEFIK